MISHGCRDVKGQGVQVHANHAALCCRQGQRAPLGRKIKGALGIEVCVLIQGKSKTKLAARCLSLPQDGLAVWKRYESIVDLLAGF